MSSEVALPGGDSPPICEFCGFEIEHPEQECAALDEGVCRP